MPQRDLGELLKRFYPERKGSEADDPAMEAHLRLLLEQAEDALDRQSAGRANLRK